MRYVQLIQRKRYCRNTKKEILSKYKERDIVDLADKKTILK